jgi:hypothetical protein
MTIFDFIEIKKELIATLEGETTDAGALVTDVKYAEGTVRNRKDGDYRKQGGKWVKIYEKEGKGASLAVTHAVKKIKAAQSVDELMDLVNANISRFYDKNGKLLPVVARLRDAVNESKTRINSAKKEKEKQTQEKLSTTTKQPSTSEIMKFISQNQDKVFDEVENRKNADSKYQELERVEKEASATKRELEKKFLKDRKEGNTSALKEDKKALKEATENYQKASDATLSYEAELQKQIATQLMTGKAATPAETPTQKIEKPDFLNGRFNGKVYGNAKYGYRVYVDGKEKSITAEQKKQVDAWQKQESEKKETQKEKKKSVTNLESHLLDISLENRALDISNLASKAIKNPSNWEKYKKSDNVFSYPSNIALMEKNANTPEEKAIIERLKTDKDFADTVNKTYIQLVENKMKQMKDEQATKQGYDNRQTQIDDYIKANGTPDIVKNGFWNGKVYGSEKSGYSVYIDGKKKTLSEADKKQFGLK